MKIQKKQALRKKLKQKKRLSQKKKNQSQKQQVLKLMQPHNLSVQAHQDSEVLVVHQDSEILVLLVKDLTILLLKMVI